MKDVWAWSFSVLSIFEQCRKKYFHLKVKKDVKDGDSEASREGKLIHDALHHRVIDAKPLPVPMRHMEAMAARFADAPGEKFGEMRMALNRNFEPRGFFAKDVWVRAVLDLLIVRDNRATLIDWKTGKKKLDWTQLQLSAAVLSRLMPEITEFKLVFVWLRDSDASIETISKSDLKAVWLKFLPRVQQIGVARQTTEFPASEGPLCGWCPVTTCPNWVDRDRD